MSVDMMKYGGPVPNFYNITLKLLFRNIAK